MCVCLSVCLSVRLWPLQFEITFDPMARLWSNFQGPLISLQVIFGPLIWTPRPSGSGPDPEKCVFCQIYLLPGYWGRGVVSYLLGNGTTRQKNVGSGILIFGPGPEKTGPEGRVGHGCGQNFGISTFFIKGAPSKMRSWLFYVLCNFLIWRTPLVPEVPPGPGGWKSKVKIMVGGTLTKIEF